MEPKIITTKAEVDDIEIHRHHYRPTQYLKNYLFSKKILLDVFCSEYLVYCYEDYYYDDISLKQIAKYQPHIDIDEFKTLWDDLNEIRIAKLYCNFLIKKPTTGLYFYDLITDYSEDLNHTELINNFGKMLQENRFIAKHIVFDETQNHKNTEHIIIEKAKQILAKIPSEYSSLLPL